MNRVFMIGTSAGGVVALHRLLEDLDPRIKSPIVVVQHLPDINHVDVSAIYESGSRTVLEIEDKMPLERNHVYFAPGGYHLLLDKLQTFSLTQDEPIRYSRPSIDLSFESAAQVLNDRLIAILLTGANSDGAEGLVKVRAHGGRTVVQDPKTADFPEMPTAAIELQKPDFIVTLQEMPALILRLSGEVGE